MPDVFRLSTSNMSQVMLLHSHYDYVTFSVSSAQRRTGRVRSLYVVRGNGCCYLIVKAKPINKIMQ